MAGVSRVLGTGMNPQDDVDKVIRGPQSYPLAKRALEMMETAAVWPTPLNFEIWLHVAGAPDSELAVEINALIEAGTPLTEEISEELAGRYLPKQRLNQEIRDTGDKLARELSAVSDAVRTAQVNQANYGETLSAANKELDLAGDDPENLRGMVGRLAKATRAVQAQNSELESRLSASNIEVSQLKLNLEQVRRDATTDALTNLANRKAFDEELERTLSEADASGDVVTLALMDIDHFKSFNDTWGHQTGDQVLRFVASVIGRAAAPPRFAARYGGEEFALIFTHEPASAAHRTLEEIRGEISTRVLRRRSTNEELGQITISGGFASRVPSESAESLMERADDALYASKHGGRNRNTKSEAPPKEQAA
jgi:diguanylate cyclase